MKHLNSFITTLAILISISSSIAQYDKNSTRNNSFYIEGKSFNSPLDVGFFSLNYDRRFGQKKVPSVRIGFSADFHYTSFGIPISITWLTNPRGKHHFEGGIGATHRIEAHDGKVNHDTFSMIIAQYRYTGKKGFLLRSGVNYYGYGFVFYYPVQISLTLSLGYSF